MHIHLPLPTQQGKQGKQRSRVINNGDPLRGKWVKRFFYKNTELYFRGEKILNFKSWVLSLESCIFNLKKTGLRKRDIKLTVKVPNLNGLDNCHFLLPCFDTGKQWNGSYLVRLSYGGKKKKAHGWVLQRWFYHIHNMKMNSGEMCFISQCLILYVISSSLCKNSQA